MGCPPLALGLGLAGLPHCPESSPIFFFFFPQGRGHLGVWGPSLSDQILHLFTACGCLVTVNSHILQCGREFVTKFVTDPTRRPHLNNLSFLIQEGLSPRTSLPTPGF